MVTMWTKYLEMGNFVNWLTRAYNPFYGHMFGISSNNSMTYPSILGGVVWKRDAPLFDVRVSHQLFLLR